MSDRAPDDTGTRAPGWVTTPIRRRRPPAEDAGLAAWRATARPVLADLLRVDPARHDGHLAGAVDRTSTDPQSIMLRTEDAEIPCWLLLPPAGRRLGAAVVAVAGHGVGIDALVEDSPAGDDYHGGLARRLAAAGVTVLCPEMISFGRRRTPGAAADTPNASSCQVDAMRGLLTGHPVLGRRVSDTMAAVRAVGALDGVDPARVGVLGGSGGGAVALLAAALDDRVAAALVATYFSSFADSLGAVPHCICNAVPDLLTAFEMTDLAALVAPRRLILEAGRHDPIFPIGATEVAYAELLSRWQGLDTPAPDLVTTDAGHRFTAEAALDLLVDALTH